VDIEFHYHITYLVSKRAGFSNEEANIIAYSSQYTDDNSIMFVIDKGLKTEYRNYISQTMNIFNPPKKLLRIYPLFHFIPGDYDSQNVLRKDGKMHILNTTPASKNALSIFQAALNSNNLFRIGIACHAFADTFAHQNFVGYHDSFNSMKGLLEKALPQIGHAEALSKPDWPGLIWGDERLLSSFSRVSNKERFILAAENIYALLRRYKYPEIKEDQLKSELSSLKDDIATAIGEHDTNNSGKSERIKRYQILSQGEEYGNVILSGYNKKKWMEEVISGILSDFGIKIAEWLNYLFPKLRIHSWKKNIIYKESNWFKFQEAVKDHQNEAWDILNKYVFSKIELEKL